MIKRKVGDCIDEALELLPKPVSSYMKRIRVIDGEEIPVVPIFIDKIGIPKEGGGVEGYMFTSAKERNDINWEICCHGFFYSIIFDDDTVESCIVIDKRIKTKRRILTVVLHEAAHAWLEFRGLKNTEQRAGLLGRLWLKRKRATVSQDSPSPLGGS